MAAATLAMFVMLGADPRAHGLEGEGAGTAWLPQAAHPSDSVLKLAAVGRLESAAGPFCTATLVAPRIVVTSARCMWDSGRKAWRRPRDIVFKALYHRGRARAKAKVVAVELPPSVKGPDDFQNSRFDWALLTLDADLSSTVTPLPVEPFDRKALERHKARGSLFFEVGYAPDKPEEFENASGCLLREISEDDKLMADECLKIGGDWGKALLLRLHGKYSLAGIHSRTITYQGRRFGFAVPGKTIHERLGGSPSLKAEDANP